MDWAKREDVLESLSRTTWDLVIVDEVHRMSASDPKHKTERYRLGELLSQQTHHLLLLTGTPHKGDPEYSCPDANTQAQSPPTPRRGFGKIWCTYPAVRQGLGWATDHERGFHGTVQDFSQGTILRTDTGETYVMVKGGGWWRE